MRIGNIFLQFRDIEKMNAASYNIKGVQNENFKISVQRGSAYQSSAGKCRIGGKILYGKADYNEKGH